MGPLIGSRKLSLVYVYGTLPSVFTAQAKRPSPLPCSRIRGLHLQGERRGTGLRATEGSPSTT